MKRAMKRLGTLVETMAVERPVLLVFLLFVCAAILVMAISIPFYINEPHEMLLNVVAEAHGTVFDLFVIGFLLFWLNRLADRRLRNNRYREEIEDFLGWKSMEATHRIVGNIRRLNRNGMHERLRLTEAFLQEANLAGAWLQEADLWGAHLARANLRDARLARANLAGANLEGADVEGADLAGADLRGANLVEADLERSTLVGADLRAAVLRQADLQYANLQQAQLERADLTGANLRSANLVGANLSRCILTEASLRGASLVDANLGAADLTDADLSAADLTGVALPETNEELVALFGMVRSLDRARLDAGLNTALRRACPHLFAPMPAFVENGGMDDDIALARASALAQRGEPDDAARRDAPD
jgi:BTB/POZ domain-containing protein KCTD9